MLRALAGHAVGRNLANPLRANALVGSVVHSLTKDDRLTIRRAVTLARQFRAFDPARLANPGKVFPRPRLCGERPGPYVPHPLELSGVAERF